MSSEYLDFSQIGKCGPDHIPKFEIQYDVGSTYLVCDGCSRLSFFSRFIKNKRGITP